MIRMALLLAMAFAGPAFYGDDAGRTKLAGKWLVDDANASSNRTTWSLEEKGDAIHIAYSQGDRKVEEFECNTVGQECTIKDSGRPAKISMWYNGPKLVEMETRGSDVVKRQFSTAENGDVLEIQVVPIAPAGKTETIRLKRVETAPTHQ